MSSSSPDTAPEAARRQLEIWREMTPQERATLANQLSIDVSRLAIAGIAAQLPGSGPAEVRHELARRRYGRPLADAAFADPADA
jgi:hypothetical protein